MTDLVQYVDIDLMIAAATNMGDRADEIDLRRVEMYHAHTPFYAFGGWGGEADYPTSYSTAGRVYSPGFLWFSDTVYMEHQTFDVDTPAPWADDLHSKWRAAILNRGAEAFDIQRELYKLKRCIMQYLEDTNQVDLESAGLLEDTYE